MTMTKIRKVFLIILLLEVAAARSVYPDEPGTVSLDSLVEEALKNNPRIQAAYDAWKAAEYKVAQASAFPDPTARYAYFGQPVETKVGPQQHKFGISQKVPFPVKLGLRANAQIRQARILREKYEAAKREVIKDTAFVYYDILWVDRAIQITEEEKAILENLEKVARRKYESRLAPQQDVIKAQVEITKLINELSVLRQNRSSLEARMNSILNRPGGTALGRIADVRPVKFKHKLSRLREMALESRQELLAANLSVEKAQFEKSLAEFDYIPDVTLGFDYIQVGNGYTRLHNDGEDAWMGTVAINVPLWFDRLGARVREKKALLKSSRKNYDDVKNIVEYEVEDLYFKVTTYWDIIMLYKTALIPQAEQSFDAARTAYETGSVDFLNWLESERVLLQTRLAYYRAMVDYLKSVAYLERVVGRSLRES